MIISESNRGSDTGPRSGQADNLCCSNLSLIYVRVTRVPFIASKSMTQFDSAEGWC